MSFNFQEYQEQAIRNIGRRDRKIFWNKHERDRVNQSSQGGPMMHRQQPKIDEFRQQIRDTSPRRLRIWNLCSSNLSEVLKPVKLTRIKRV